MSSFLKLPDNLLNGPFNTWDPKREVFVNRYGRTVFEEDLYEERHAREEARKLEKEAKLEAKKNVCTNISHDPSPKDEKDEEEKKKQECSRRLFPILSS
jgi:hypothetical protein